MTSDAELKRGVITALTADAEIADNAKRVIRWTTIDPDGFRVAVDHGWVTLQGEAWYDLECHSVENAIRQLPGVTGVTNQIAVANGSLQA